MPLGDVLSNPIAEGVEPRAVHLYRLVDEVGEDDRLAQDEIGEDDRLAHQ